MSSAPRPVLVVFPRGSRAQTLLDVGVAEARRRNAGLHLLRVVAPDQVVEGDPSPESLLEALHRRADDLSGGTVEVTSEELTAEVATAVADRERSCGLVVLPLQETIRFPEAGLSEEAEDVTEESRVPVLLVPEWWEPGERRPRGVVVAGIERLEDSAPVILEAAHEAQIRGARLVLLHAFRHHLGHGGAPDGSPAWLQDEFPGLDVSLRQVHGDPARSLVAAGEEADLLVVGRGGPLLGSDRLGRTSHEVLDTASCPVLVVEPDGQAG